MSEKIALLIATLLMMVSCIACTSEGVQQKINIM